jgi:large subunit ribosomal protein L30e
MAKKDKNLKLEELKKKLLDGKAVVGIDRVLKELKRGNLKKIFLAMNSREDLRKDVLYYSGLQKVVVEELETSNEELGVICKKNFFVSVVGTVD